MVSMFLRQLSDVVYHSTAAHQQWHRCSSSTGVLVAQV